MVSWFVAHLRNIDLSLFHFINGFCGQSLTLDRIARRLDSVSLKGLAFSGTFGVLWFQSAKVRYQRWRTLILALIGIVLAIVVARLFANLLPFRVRPMFTSDIGYRPPLFSLGSSLEDWSSFPSDTAAITFAMATGFWLVSRWWGLVWFCFAIAALVARIYSGMHYPGDVIVGALIGIGTTLAVNNSVTRANIASPITAIEQRAAGLFYGLLLPFIYEISEMFDFIRGLRHAIFHVVYAGAFPLH
jgi:undecaprenyl-diphosphatase